ncbi:lipase family protein [Roseateles sp. L2-2]|uniref:lipase family protein n=1 Tax=Roseateles sp. L2-2 TaxID=3422597 RepID=UPI003D3675BE
MIAYDSSPTALFFPETRPTVFGTAAIPSEEALAIEAARLAYLCFETQVQARLDLTSALRAADFGGPTTFNDRSVVPIGFFTDSQGYAALRKADGLAILAFRGTQPTRPRDILLDFDFHTAASPHWPGSVHHGFLHAAEALWPDVKAWLEGEGASRKLLLVCGHSLGAAIATLIAMRSKAERLITIGAPRVGDATFVAGLAATQIKRTRIVDSDDIVTQLPPKFLGYRHPNDGVLIEKNGHINLMPNPAQVDQDVGLQILFNLAVPSIEALPPVLSDHATVNYLRAYWP